MAKVVNKGYTDTAISGNPTLTFTRGALNFGADFRQKSVTANEVILANITSPVDRTEQIRYAYSSIANVYAGTSIEPSLAAPTKRGVSMLVQVTDTISVTDSVDPNYRIDLPVSYHLVVKVPANENLTAALILEGVGRLVSSLYETGGNTTSRIEGLIRGSLVPTDL